jgi:hypothetical protein
MKPSILPASRRGVSRQGFIPEDVIPASRGGVSAEAMTPCIDSSKFPSLNGLSAPGGQRKRGVMESISTVDGDA